MFETHFFCKKDRYNEEVLVSIRKSMELLRPFDKRHFGGCVFDEIGEKIRLTEVVSEEDDCIFGECDFTMLCVFFEHLCFKQSTFNYIVDMIARFAGNVLKNAPEIPYAIGMQSCTSEFFELIENKASLEDFAPPYLWKFPFVYIRPDTASDSSSGEVVYKDDSVKCLYHQGEGVPRILFYDE
jgi:hypothetical protein